MIDGDPILCWFCGRSIHGPFLNGWAIGNMVHSSFNDPSGRRTIVDEQLKMFHNLHFGHDGANICESCVRSSANAVEITDDYDNSMRSQKHEAALEMLDYETGLIDDHERSLHFMCWFEAFPGPFKANFKSRCFAELFELGFRMQGTLKINEDCFGRFVSRFASNTRMPASSEFVDHFSNRLGVERSAVRDLASVSAQICDLAIYDAALARFEGLIRRDSNAAWYDENRNRLLRAPEE